MTALPRAETVPIFAVTKSLSLAKHFAAAMPMGTDCRIVGEVDDIATAGESPRIVLLHAPSLAGDVVSTVRRIRVISNSAIIIIGIASDDPT